MISKKRVLIALGFLVLVGMVSWGSSFWKTFVGFDQAGMLQPRAFDLAIEKDFSGNYRSLGESLRKPAVSKLINGRPLFKEQKEIQKRELFILHSVKPEEIPIVFKGSIVRGDEVVIAQINWGNKTYFVKPGEVIDGWNILKIEKEKVEIESPNGEKSILYLNETSFSKQLIANIEVTDEASHYFVREGDALGGFQVESISEGNVILANKNSKMTIEKK